MKPPLRRVRIRARRGWRGLDLAELWHYRELLLVLATRDIKVRYKQTSLGAAWAIVQPLFTMVLFTMISRLGNLSTDGAPPQVFYYCGMLPWLLFANGLTGAGQSLVGNRNLVTKVYFPRMIIPIASVVTGLIDFAVAFVVLLVLMLVYGVPFGPSIALAPLFVALAFLAALGMGIGLAAANVQFRDLRHVIPFGVQLWLFATPILYASSSVTTPWKRALLGLNPLSGVVEGFRAALLGRPQPVGLVLVSAAAIVAALVASVFYFRRIEPTFADRV